jgi:hypothetical protein
MKKLSFLFITTVLIGTAPAFAINFPNSAANSVQPNTALKSVSMKADSQEYKSMLNEAFAMMGYVSVANMALTYDMTPEAAENVQKALTIARKLEGQTNQLNADMIKLGKLKYHSANGNTHDYWLPLVNDTFAIKNLDAGYLNAKDPTTVEDDAQIDHMKINLNVKDVRDSLEKAATAISNRNYDYAQEALVNAQESTYTDVSVHETPLVTAHDNLALARELANSNDYNGASFALGHAKDALKEYQQTTTKKNSAKVGRIKKEISSMQADIARDKASISANIQKRIGVWMHNIQGLGIENG